MSNIIHDEIKEIYTRFRDEEEIKVGYFRTYDSIFQWLTNKPPLRGLGFDETFVTKLMASVADKIKRGTLLFNSGQELDIYLKNRCIKYTSRAMQQGLRVTKQVAVEELNEIRQAEINAIKEAQIKMITSDKKAEDRKKVVRKLQISSSAYILISIIFMIFLNQIINFLKLTRNYVIGLF